MSSRDNLLDDVKSCSFEANDVDNVCCTDADSACGDGSTLISYVESAASRASTLRYEKNVRKLLK